MLHTSNYKQTFLSGLFIKRGAFKKRESVLYLPHGALLIFQQSLTKGDDILKVKELIQRVQVDT